MKPRDRSARPRRALLALSIACVAALGGCTYCADVDLDAALAPWNAKLVGVPVGASVDDVRNLLARRGIDLGYDADRRRLTGIVADVPPVDPRSLCNLVTWKVEVECRFDVEGRLQSCKAQPVGTGL